MRIAICDDEQFFIEYFTKIITDYYVHHGMTCEVVQYTNGFSLVEDFKTGKINANVIVLDIEMPEYSGVQAIKDIRKINQEIPVMFISSIETCGDVAVEYGICKYVYKSAGEEKIYKAFDSLLSEEKYMKLTYKMLNENIKILEIMYIKVKGHNVEFHTENNILTERNTIANLQNDSRFEKFITISRNTLVNYCFIADISQKIILKNDEQLKFSVDRKIDIIQKYLYLSRRNQI